MVGKYPQKLLWIKINEILSGEKRGKISNDIFRIVFIEPWYIMGKDDQRLMWNWACVSFQRKGERKTSRERERESNVSHGLPFLFRATTTWLSIWYKQLTTYACKTCPFCLYLYPFFSLYTVWTCIVVTEKFNSNDFYIINIM